VLVQQSGSKAVKELARHKMYKFAEA